MTAEKWIKLFKFQLLRLQLFVTRGGITRRSFAFLTRFAAFDGDDFPCHKLFFFFDRLFFRLVVVCFNFRRARIVYRAELADAPLTQRTVAF